MFMRIVRFALGVLLLPFCLAASRTVVSLVHAIQPESAAAVPPSAWALAGGFALWNFLYFTLPRPVRTYVLAHELTHALWGWVMGARIFHLRISRESGSVTLSKSNFLVTLAPYFFPLYTVLVILGYYALSVFFAVEAYHMVWLGLVGLTWGFHLTFTVDMLIKQQNDVQHYGRLFSYSVIYLLNVLGIGLWIVMVSSATLEQMVTHFSSSVVAARAGLWTGAVWLWTRAAGWFSRAEIG